MEATPSVHAAAFAVSKGCLHGCVSVHIQTRTAEEPFLPRPALTSSAHGPPVVTACEEPRQL